MGVSNRKRRVDASPTIDDLAYLLFDHPHPWRVSKTEMTDANGGHLMCFEPNDAKFWKGIAAAVNLSAKASA